MEEYFSVVERPSGFYIVDFEPVEEDLETTVTQERSNLPLSGSYTFSIVKVLTSTEALIAQVGGFLNEDEYLVSEDQIFMYKRDDQWIAAPGFTFVKPIHGTNVKTRLT